jgi:hypothetical protein
MIIHVCALPGSQRPTICFLGTWVCVHLHVIICLYKCHMIPIHVKIHINTQAFMYTHYLAHRGLLCASWEREYVCMYTLLCAYWCVVWYQYMLKYIYSFRYAYDLALTESYIHTQIHTYTHTYIHIHMYIENVLLVKMKETMFFLGTC